MEVGNSICTANGSKIISADNHPESLIGYWKFDDRYALDYSGNNNHMFPVPEVGAE